MSKTKISQHGNRSQVRRETNTRQNASLVWPHRSSNGSTITIDATDRGVRISWHGGRALYGGAIDDEAAANGNHHSPENAATYSQQPDEGTFFESDDDASDDDAQHSRLVQSIDLRLGAPAISLAKAFTPPRKIRLAKGTIDLLSSSIAFAAALEDGTVKAILLPLDPPSSATKRKRRYAAQICSFDTGASGATVRSVALCWKLTRQGDEKHPSGPFHLMAAIATTELSGRLHLFHVPIAVDDYRPRLEANKVQEIHSVYLKAFPTTVSFGGAFGLKVSHLLVTHISGLTSIFNFNPSSHAPEERPSPQWLRHYSAPLISALDSSAHPPTYRQRVLDAKWVLGAGALLVLLESGTFGLYNIDAHPPPGSQSTSPLGFAFSASINDAPEHAATEAASASTLKPKRAQLAPMTPNTRRTKSETLFTGPPAGAVHAASRGGIATSSNIVASAFESDDAVVLWYGARIFAMPSLRDYWAKQVRREQSGGSMYGTGLSLLDDVDLCGEAIMAVNILPPRLSNISGVDRSNPNGSGARANVAWRYDVQVAGEYKTVVLSTARMRDAMGRAASSTAVAAATDGAGDEEDDSPSRRADTRLLRRGELGVDGMDRMLDSMVGVEPTSRRVGFRD